MSRNQEANDRTIEQDQADQQRRTVGATLAALGTTHSNPAERDRAASELEAVLTEAFPNAGNHRKAGRMMAEDMGKAGFTPGPWDVKPLLTPDEDDDPMGAYVVSQAEADLSQRYYAAEAESPELESVHAENAANARLIAAAPTMYDQLDRIANGEFANSVTPAEQVSAMREVARAALAKARGT